jgi:hypothetical protein
VPQAQPPGPQPPHPPALDSKSTSEPSRGDRATSETDRVAPRWPEGQFASFDDSDIGRSSSNFEAQERQ